jgi:hypothetical protein
VPERNWNPISQAPKGAGPLLLRDGSGPLDPVYVGHQDNDGRRMFGVEEVHPTHFCLIPNFDGADA